MTLSEALEIIEIRDMASVDIDQAYAEKYNELKTHLDNAFDKEIRAELKLQIALLEQAIELIKSLPSTTPIVKEESLHPSEDTYSDTSKSEDERAPRLIPRLFYLGGIIACLGFFVYLLLPDSCFRSPTMEEIMQGQYLTSKMVLVPKGRFKMGDNFGMDINDEKPLHNIRLSSFYLGRTEITVREFSDFIDVTAYKTTAEQMGGSFTFTGDTVVFKGGVTWRDDIDGIRRRNTENSYPVIHVSWYDAIAYCNWLSGQHGLKPVYRISGSTVAPDWSANGYRLPTEAEWEYAARSGGKNEKWAGTSNEKELIQFANFSGSADGYEGRAPVGKLQANNLDLADMSGNVWEWCWDWKDEYKGTAATNPRGAVSGVERVLRGGSWSSSQARCRAANRNEIHPTYRDYDIGFRLARTL